ncbi:MAG: hypothetical protein IJK42_08020 [Prevotella sp.]|nr:hypothetical protein [Prevotella sp.]MBQ6209702.1 hypothetical protein [Prevotella sp.]
MMADAAQKMLNGGICGHRMPPFFANTLIVSTLENAQKRAYFRPNDGSLAKRGCICPLSLKNI